MKAFQLFSFGLIAFAVALTTGCGNQPGGTPKGGEKAVKKGGEKEDAHEHGDGPHGGTVADWGGGKFHVEFCMDHGKKQASVYILDSNAKKAVPIKAEKILLTIKQPSFQIELKAMPQEGEPQGSASRFVGTHDNFAKEQEFAGTISGEVDGKPYAGDFKEVAESPKKQ